MDGSISEFDYYRNGYLKIMFDFIFVKFIGYWIIIGYNQYSVNKYLGIKKKLNFLYDKEMGFSVDHSICFDPMVYSHSLYIYYIYLLY